MAAVSGSGEESALGEAPAEEIQEQDAPSMMAMMALLVEKVGGIQDAVDQVSARTMVLEGAMADASMSGGTSDRARVRERGDDGHRVLWSAGTGP